MPCEGEVEAFAPKREMPKAPRQRSESVLSLAKRFLKHTQGILSVITKIIFNNREKGSARHSVRALSQALYIVVTWQTIGLQTRKDNEHY